MGKKVVIVGGVAGGASAAARLRRVDETAEIILLEKDEYVSFANCGLPYHIGGTIARRSDLIVQTPQSLHARFGIDVRNNSRVVAVDTAAKTVTVESEAKGTYTEGYDYLVLAPGAEPIVPDIPNTAPDRTFSLRNIPDTDAIMAYLSGHAVKTAVVVGGGYVGVEMAENLRDRDIAVTLVEAAPHILAPFDSEIALLAERELQRNGVRLILGDGLQSIVECDEHAVITLQSGVQLTADMVISAIGVRAATGFLRDSGIKLSAKGHILVDDGMCTSVPDVYAVGDAVEVVDFVTGQPVTIPLAGPANKQGRIVADNIAGLKRTYKGTQGTAILKIFALTAACTGVNERMLKKLELPHTAIYAHPFSHATYYPGAVQLTCKLLFAPDGRILGCQIIGAEGVDKRIDVIATTMRLGGLVTDLCDLELAYAPPYSSARDPVNMLGYIAQNILESSSRTVDHAAVAARNRDTTILLDVRTTGEFERGHIPGAVNIPVDELRERLDELDKDKEIIEYCQVGLRGHVAERILSQHGFAVKNLSGGYATYAAQGYGND